MLASSVDSCALAKGPEPYESTILHSSTSHATGRRVFIREKLEVGPGQKKGPLAPVEIAVPVSANICSLLLPCLFRTSPRTV